MNCKPGDLAILVHSVTGREGAIVEVIKPDIHEKQHVWVVSYRGTTAHPDDFGQCIAFDSWLRPLRGDLLNDEITTSKELETT